MRIRIGTRGSKLALTQTRMFIDALESINSEIHAKPVIIKTKGDIILDRSLDKIGDKGLFVAEIEEQLRMGLIDMAIHSMKDLPTEDTDEFLLFPVLRREDPRDVLVTKHNIDSIDKLPENAVIGTGSKRRKVLFEKIHPGVEVVPIRGNVETRIKKMLEQPMDGTILAAAGIRRLGIKNTEDYKIIPMNVDEMIPAPAQGILACQVIRSNQEVIDIVKQLVDDKTYVEAMTERAFLKEVNGGCHIPIGAYLDQQKDSIKLHYLYGNENCEKIVKETIKVSDGSDKEEILDDLVKKVKKLAQAAKLEVEE